MPALDLSLALVDALGGRIKGELDSYPFPYPCVLMSLNDIDTKPSFRPAPMRSLVKLAPASPQV